MLTFKLNTNRQTFNKRFATSEKSSIFKSHKSYKNSLWLIFTQKTCRKIAIQHKEIEAKNIRIYLTKFTVFP